MTGYHLTCPTNRESILERGLLTPAEAPRLVYDRDQAYMRRFDAVYFFATLEALRLWVDNYTWGTYPQDADVWEIDLSGWEDRVEDDPYAEMCRATGHPLQHARCVPFAVKPDRLKLVAA